MNLQTALFLLLGVLLTVLAKNITIDESFIVGSISSGRGSARLDITIDESFIVGSISSGRGSARLICILSDKSKQTQSMDGYGTEWMYFPDGDDIPRRISLEVPPSGFLRRTFWADGIEYRLYTKYNKNNYILLDESATPLNETSSTSRILENLRKAPIKIITHGWESSGDKSAVINIKDAYLDMQDVNVVGVDWSYVADSIFYPVVAMQTSMVGEAVGQFIDALSEQYNVSGCQFHLIGHSLGAHVMGNAGATTKLTIDRITGLDPARPLFEVPSIPNQLKLDTSDAQFVDVIHTCTGVLGVQDPIGHADFYPNNGEPPQPGCDGIQPIFEACSHSRSHFLFTESIRRPKAFPAYQCANWTSFMNNECTVRSTYLGEYANRSAHGTFYLITNNNKPYGRGY